MDDLQEQIKAALSEALDRMVATGVYAYPADDRGLAAGESGSGGVHIRLTLDDVARIASQTARAWF